MDGKTWVEIHALAREARAKLDLAITELNLAAIHGAQGALSKLEGLIREHQLDGDPAPDAHLEADYDDRTTGVDF